MIFFVNGDIGFEDDVFGGYEVSVVFDDVFVKFYVGDIIYE